MSPKDYIDYKKPTPSEKKFRMVIKFKVTGVKTSYGVLIYDTVAKNLVEAFAIATKLCEELSSDGRTGEIDVIREIDAIRPNETLY